MIVRCRVCKQLIVPAPAVAIFEVGGQQPTFKNLLADCTRHSAEAHPELFRQITAVAGQVIASLALELFESRESEVSQYAAELRSLAVTAVNQTAYSEVNGTFELREPEQTI